MHLHLRPGCFCQLVFVESLHRWLETLLLLFRNLVYSITFSHNVLHQGLLLLQHNYMDLHRFGQVLRILE